MTTTLTYECLYGIFSSPLSSITGVGDRWMLRTFRKMYPDYTALLRRLCDPLQLRTVELIVQFPFVMPAVDSRVDEERAHTGEKRRKQGKRLQEWQAKNPLKRYRGQIKCIPNVL